MPTLNILSERAYTTSNMDKREKPEFMLQVSDKRCETWKICISAVLELKTIKYVHWVELLNE